GEQVGVADRVPAAADRAGDRHPLHALDARERRRPRLDEREGGGPRLGAAAAATVSTGGRTTASGWRPALASTTVSAFRMRSSLRSPKWGRGRIFPARAAAARPSPVRTPRGS